MQTFKWKLIVLFLFVPFFTCTTAAQGIGLGIKNTKPTPANNEKAIQSTLPNRPYPLKETWAEKQPGFEQQSFHLLYYERGRTGAGIDWNPHRDYGKGCKAGAASSWSQGETWLNEIRETKANDQSISLSNAYLQGFKDGLYRANQKELEEVEFSQISRNGLPIRIETEWRLGFVAGMVPTGVGQKLDPSAQSARWNEGFEQAKSTKQKLAVERENQMKGKAIGNPDF